MLILHNSYILNNLPWQTCGLSVSMSNSIIFWFIKLYEIQTYEQELKLEKGIGQFTEGQTRGKNPYI